MVIKICSVPSRVWLWLNHGLLDTCTAVLYLPPTSTIASPVKSYSTCGLGSPSNPDHKSMSSKYPAWVHGEFLGLSEELSSWQCLGRFRTEEHCANLDLYSFTLISSYSTRNLGWNFGWPSNVVGGNETAEIPALGFHSVHNPNTGVSKNMIIHVSGYNPSTGVWLQRCFAAQ